MYHRRAAGRALLMAVPLLLQTLLASFPVPAMAARPAADPSGIVETSKRLPSATERLGLKETPAHEETYTPPRSEEETSAPAEDGSFTLPPGYKENPEQTPPGDTKGSAYAAERRAGGKKGGGIEVMRLNVSGNITANTTWALTDSPIVVSGTVNVQSPAVLTIEPGVVVKFEAAGSLVVQNGATLTAVGTSTDRIVFTSMKDDSVAGDTNGDGTATTPAYGDWGDLSFPGLNSGGVFPSLGSLQFADVRYGNQLYVRYSKPALSDLKITDMAASGLYLEAPANTTYTIDRLTLLRNRWNAWLYAVPTNTTIQNSIFRESRETAIIAQSSTAAKLTSNVIERNGTSSLSWAITASSSPMVLRYNAIRDNRRSSGKDYALQATGSTVDAQYNWWGSTSGPEVEFATNTGGGAVVSSTGVTITNWLGSAFEIDHKRGNLPWAAKAGTGVDVASGNFVYTDTDVSIPTIGFPLEITRTYNNQTAAVAGGDFGAGWTWTYGTNLNTAADAFGGVVWERADGTKSYFKKNPDNSFTGEDGIYSTLIYDPTALQYTLTHKDQTKFLFNSTGKLIKQLDTDGNETVIARDGSGKIQTVTEPTGRQLTVTYTGNTITQIVDPLGRAFIYTYYAGTPTAVLTVTRKDAVGGATYASCSYGYSSWAYQLTTVTDCGGDTLTMTYDASKRVTTQRLNDNGTQRFTYGPGTDTPTGLTFAAGSTGVADQRGRMHVYFYVTKSNKVFETWHEWYEQFGTYHWYQENLWDYVGYLQTSHRDIDQKTTTYKWDARGNLLEETKPGSRKTTYTYDVFNNRTSSKDNLNRTTTFEYDAEQHLTKVIDPLTRETTTTYTTAGLPATVTDARSNVTTFTYDGWGYPETVTNAESETLTFDYDAGGRKLWEETPQAKRTAYTYNSRDQVLTVADPLSNVTTTTYDTRGRKATVTDAESRATTFTYNTTRNVLWKVTDAKSGVVEFTYDNAGPSLTQVKDASGDITTFTYDLVFGRKATEKDALNNTLTWTYKPSGLLASFKDALNRTTSYTYDTANDLVTIAYPDSTTVTQTFDGVGNRLTMTDWLGTHTSVYDALNRVTSATDAASNVIGYTYDEVGNLATVTYPGSKTVTYTYDDANRIATITDWDSRVTSYTYDASGRIGSFTLANGVVTTYGYDDASRTSSITHVNGASTIAARSYTFDDVGNRLGVNRGAASDSYTYDELYRITGITYSDGGAQNFAYDATGNRSSETRDGITKNFTYDIADQLTNAGDGVRTYNANGELTKIGSHLGFTWDVRGKLTQVTTTPTNTAPTANAGADKTVYVNQLVILDGRSSADAEGEPLSSTWTEGGSNPQTGILRGSASPQPGFTATTAGTYTFSLTVSDGRTSSTADSVTITVLAGTPATQTLTGITTGATSGYVANTTRTFNQDMMVGKNGPGNTYTGIAQFALPAVPAGTSLTGASLTLMGKSNTGNVAGDLWSVDLLPTALDANWTVTSTGAAVTGATADSTLTPELSGVNQVVASSPDTWTLSSGEVAILANRLAGSGKLSIRARGNGASTSSRVNWHGGNATTSSNRPVLSLTFSATPQYDHAPIARAGLDQTVAAGTVTLDGSGSYDYEDASVTHAWTQLAGSTVTLSSTTAAAPTFTGTPGTYIFRDTVTDSASQTAADEVTITVLPQTVPATTTYAYNGDGDRMSQTAGGVTTSYVVNSVPKLAQVLMETTGGSTTYFVYGHDLLYSVKADGPHFHHADSLGSTIAVTDSTGAVEQTMDYDVFGRMRSMTGSNGTTTYTFTGEENDATALVYLRARYYDPAVGRFLSRDPYPADALDTQTLNGYVYVKNNPTNYVDPSGEIPDPTDAAVLLCGPAAPACFFGKEAIEAAGMLGVTIYFAAKAGKGSGYTQVLTGGSGASAPDPGDQKNRSRRDKALRRLEGRPTSELTKSLKSLEKQIQFHLNKIQHPEQFIKGWAELPFAVRLGTMYHWWKEVAGFSEQASMIREVLYTR